MFGILHADGSGETDPPIEALSSLYDELLTTDAEHGDVSVIDDRTAWCLSAYRDGRVILGNLQGGGERHMLSVPKEQVLDMWRKVAAGDIDSVLAEPWQPGLGT